MIYAFSRGIIFYKRQEKMHKVIYKGPQETEYMTTWEREFLEREFQYFNAFLSLKQISD